MSAGDPTSLDRLHDIVMPPPTPWWPPAPGWLWLLGFVAVVAVFAGLRRFARWQGNRYRREALAVLDQLVAAGDAPSAEGDFAARLSALLKRVALTAYGRPAVAALTGDGWFRFLDETGGTAFASGLGDSLEAAVYRPGTAREFPRAELVAEVRRWIRAHGPLLPGATVPATEGSDPALQAGRKAA